MLSKVSLPFAMLMIFSENLAGKISPNSAMIENLNNYFGPTNVDQLYRFSEFVWHLREKISTELKTNFAVLLTSASFLLSGMFWNSDKQSSLSLFRSYCLKRAKESLANFSRSCWAMTLSFRNFCRILLPSDMVVDRVRLGWEVGRLDWLVLGLRTCR